MSSERSRILVVDDEALLRDVFARVLRGAGYEILVAETGVEALTLLEDQSIDAVLSDVHMPDMDGVELARRAHRAYQTLPIVLVTGAPTIETASGAVEAGAIRYLQKPIDPTQLCEAMSEAIAAGAEARARDAFAQSERRRQEESSQLDATLSDAMKSLWVAYQPIVDAQSGAPRAFEALARSASQQMPDPCSFFAAAEQLGRVQDLGRLIRAAAPEPMPRAAREALLFVNLHALDLSDDALYDPAAALSRMADRVVLEITERSSLETVDGLVDRVRKLRGLGFRLAVDDLGAGYAGLTAIALLEPEFVKVDMGLVRGIESSKTRQTLVSAVTKLAHELGARVVAEGVETRAERDALSAANCDLLQGYLFARPGRAFPEVRAR